MAIATPSRNSSDDARARTRGVERCPLRDAASGNPPGGRLQVLPQVYGPRRYTMLKTSFVKRAFSTKFPVGDHLAPVARDDDKGFDAVSWFHSFYDVMRIAWAAR